MWSTILSLIIEINHGNKDNSGKSNGGGNNKQQSTKSSGGNGDRNGNDDSNNNDNKQECNGSIGGSVALAVAAGRQQCKRWGCRQRNNMAAAVAVAAWRGRRRQHCNGGNAVAAQHWRRRKHQLGGSSGNLGALWQAPRW
jgi:hypothetical protein